MLFRSVVVINPTEETLYRYGQLKEERQSLQKIYETSIPLSGETSDGCKVQLLANIGSFEDCQSAIELGASGVGLFRTESLYIHREHFPCEEEQFAAYKAVVTKMQPHGVIIRTLDLGGDKQIATYFEHEANPFMGYRAIRFCLEHTELFKDQLRAILRASAFGKVKLMYPMIGSVSDIVRANQLLEEVKLELRQKKIAFDPNLEVGSMIEIPSAAITADLLAEHCSFFSIGTNDLIQYLLAVDRTNDRIAHLYEPSHPAVVRTIAQITAAARKKGIPVGVCGEMAADPIYVPLLLGLGVDSLSLSPSCLPETKFFVRTMNMAEIKAMAETILRQNDSKRIFEMLKDFYSKQLEKVLNKNRD